MKENRTDQSARDLSKERKRIMANTILMGTAFSIMLLALGSMAWFANNKDVNSDGIQILLEVPQQIQISPGRTQDTVLNDVNDLLVLDEDQSVQEPRNRETGEVYDWAELIEIGKYYRFGRLFPASSDSGEVILFTPDAAETGRDLKEDARFFRADGGKTDADLKAVLGRTTNGSDDADGLMATVHAFRNASEKNLTEYWAGYRGSVSWYDTNDDGYYLDIPVWIRTTYPVSVSLKVDGYITPKDAEIVPENENGAGAEALYKAVRVALLKEVRDGGNVSLKPAVDNEILAGDNYMARNIIALRNSDHFDSEAEPTVDSKNYTITRDTAGNIRDAQYYALRASAPDELVQAPYYRGYNVYGRKWIINDSSVPEEVDDPRAITVIGPANVNEWSDSKKLIIRIWLDGDDKDCWNETAGQDWKISLRFTVMENEN